LIYCLINENSKVFGFFIFLLWLTVCRQAGSQVLLRQARAVPKALCVRRFVLYRFACGDPVLIYNI
jgi:hypothetical protein